MRHSMLVLAALFAASWLIGCGGGPEEKVEAKSARVRVSYDKYKPIHSGVTRSIDQNVVKVRLNVFASDNEVLKHHAKEDLVIIARRESRAIPMIASALNNPNPKVREYALLTLAEVGREAAGEVDTGLVKKNLGDKHIGVICAALYCIGNLGLDNRDLIKMAFEYLSHYNPEVRSFAAECIRELKYWPAIPALIYGHLNSEGAPAHIRSHAVEALENITLVHVGINPRGMDLKSLQKAWAEAWTEWWETNRYKYGG